MKTIKNIYNKVKYFFLSSYRHYEYNKSLNIFLIYLEEVGVKSVTLERNNAIITYNDGSVLELWYDSIIFFQGSFKCSKGTSFNWEEYRPNDETRYKYSELIKNHQKPKEIKEKLKINYDEFLPKSVLRKMKLKKLNKK